MLASQAFHRVEQLGVILVAQVADQHHQGAATLARQQGVGGGAVVGRTQGAVQVIDAIEQHTELGRAFHWRQVAVALGGEGRHAHRVALAQGDVAEQQAGIERVVEVREVAVLAAHAAAAVEEEDDLLVALVLVFAGDRCALACGGLPVDLTQGVAVAEFPQLMEFQPQAPARSLAHAELAEPVIHGLQLGAVEAGEVRVDAGFAGEFEDAPLMPQAERAGQVQLAGGEEEMAALERAHAVAELGVLAGMQSHPLGQWLELHGGRHLVEHLDLQ
ncbi:hypothetical protein D9M68_655120 [compost metagenome]